MKIQYCSDLHLEFTANNQFLKRNPLIPKAETLLLAGDITLFALQNKYNNFFDFVSEHFKVVYWIPGNHEYYQYDAANKSGILYEQIRPNVFLVNNQVIRLGEVKFIFSTLWSAISPANQWTIQQSISDFHVIKYRGKRFTPQHFNQLHLECRDFIVNSLHDEDKSQTIVVTHHVPTYLNYPPQYKGDPLNEAFGVELYDFIEQSGPAYWLYGHHHSNTPMFNIGRTQLITNQLGYVQNNEHLTFNREAIIELDFVDRQ